MSSPTAIDIVTASAETLAEYSRVSIAFTVVRVLDVEPNALHEAAFLLSERALAAPVTKDYDTGIGNSPQEWPAAEQWVVERDGRWLKVETQNMAQVARAG